MIEKDDSLIKKFYTVSEILSKTLVRFIISIGTESKMNDWAILIQVQLFEFKLIKCPPVYKMFPCHLD